MSQSVHRPAPPVAAVAITPTVPALSSLLKLKGITDYGNPKLNEALILVFEQGGRGGETDFYKAGENVRGVNALVLQVGGDVLLRYDGRELVLKLNVDGDERAEGLPVAEPAGTEINSLLSATGKRTRANP